MKNLITIAQAVKKLQNEDVVGVPTETVYGLAGRIGSETALKKIFSTKERPLFDPLIVHVHDLSQAQKLTNDWTEATDILARHFWPGPLTLVVKKADHVSHLITSGLDSVGIRCPNHPDALEILKQLSEPFAAPSANKFGKTSPSRAEHVLTEFNNEVAVVDGGPCQIGLESTVIRILNESVVEILRPGAITESDLRSALTPRFPNIQITRQVSQASPGHLEQHYQPRVPLYLIFGNKFELALHQIAQEHKVSLDQLIALELPPEAPLAARELYFRLHQLGQNSNVIIYYLVTSQWNQQDWSAIADRLSRAAYKQIYC